MHAIISHSTFDYDANSTVSVIVSFDTDGHIAPIYIRIGESSCKVNSFWISQKFRNVLDYHCNVIDDGVLKPILLSYHKSEDVWTIPKSSPA